VLVDRRKPPAILGRTHPRKKACFSRRRPGGASVVIQPARHKDRGPNRACATETVAANHSQEGWTAPEFSPPTLNDKSIPRANGPGGDRNSR